MQQYGMFTITCTCKGASNKIYCIGTKQQHIQCLDDRGEIVTITYNNEEEKVILINRSSDMLITWFTTNVLPKKWHLSGEMCGRGVRDLFSIIKKNVSYCYLYFFAVLFLFWCYCLFVVITYCRIIFVMTRFIENSYLSI